jgi:hypothetical protein
LQLANVRVLAATLRGLRTPENKREGLMAGTPIRLLVAGCLVIAASAPLMQSTTLPVRASGTCSSADTAVTVAVSPGVAAGHEVYTATIENFGPCNAINLVYTDNLPNATQVTFTRLNPGSWICSQPPSLTRVSCTLGQLSGASASPDNPSTALIAYDVAVPATNGNKQTVIAETHGISIRSDPSQTDPDLTNNFLGAGVLQSSRASQSFTQGSDAGINPTANVPETVQVTVPPGTYPLSVTQIFNDHLACAGAPAGDQFCANITTENGTLQTITLERNVSSTVYHQLDSSVDSSLIFHKLSACPTGNKVPAWGCIISTTTASDSSGTFYVITISTPNNGHWA